MSHDVQAPSTALHPHTFETAFHNGAQGRKRPADEDIENPRPAHRSLPASGAPPGDLTTAYASRKMLAPGATQAAIARMAELKAKGTVAPSISPPVDTDTAPPVQQNKKVPAPGATATAMASLASRGSSSNLAAAPTGGGGGSVKMPAPGATQAAMARLAGLKNTGSGLPPLAAAAAASAADYANGTVVWAKMQSFPWWPAQVQKPSPEQMRLKHHAADLFVVFYGTADYTWLPLADVRAFRVHLPDYPRFAGSKSKPLQRAIDDAWVSLGQPRPDVLGKVAAP